MRILTRYTIREVLAQLLGVFSIVVTIFMVQRFGALLQSAAEGSVGILVTLKMLTLRTAMALPSLLPAVLYVSVLLGISRLSMERELTAMAACGVRPSHVQRSVLLFAAFVVVLTGLFAFSVRPWAATRFDSLRRQAASGLELGSLVPGRFYDISAVDDYVVFAQSRDPAEVGFLQQVFVQQRRDEEVSVLFSKRAVEYRDEEQGFRFLRLIDGNRYDFREGKRSYETTRFADLVIRAPLSPNDAGEPREEGMSTAALWRSDSLKARAELQWRLSLPMASLILAMFAIPMGRVDPRHGRTINLFVALIVYVGYRNLLSIVRNWVEDGAIPMFPGVWWAHGLALLIAIPLLIRDARR